VVLLRASAIERTVVGFWIGLVRARGEDDGDENGRAMALRVGLHQEDSVHERALNLQDSIAVVWIADWRL
jgi:hypothetical protein